MLELPSPTQVPTWADMLSQANTLKAQRLQNQMMQAKMPYIAPSAQASLQLLKAQDELTQKRAQNPMIGNGLTGPAAQIQGLNYIKQQYGVNSPEYQNAMKLFNSQLNLANERANYFGSNTQYKNLPNIVKLQMAQKAAQGNPTAVSQDQGAIQKAVGTTANLNRSTYGDAIRQTLNSIPVNVLQKYSGPNGNAQLIKDRISNLLGYAPPSYNTYQTFMNSTMPLLKGQMTKFYGGSVQPEAQKELDNLANPTNWQSNPQIVKQSLQNLQNIFNKEAKTFSQAANTGAPAYKPANIPGLNATTTVMIKAPNGQIYHVPTSDLQNALNAGGKQIG